jgi:hypothetical protein
MLAMTHAAALVVLPFLQLPPWLVMTLAVLLLLGYRRACRVHIHRRHPDCIRQLVWGSGNDWRLTLVSGERVRARLRPYAFVLPRLVILYFHQANGRTSCIVLPADTLDPVLFRRLRVRLRIELPRIVATGDA